MLIKLKPYGPFKNRTEYENELREMKNWEENATDEEIESLKNAMLSVLKERGLSKPKKYIECFYEIIDADETTEKELI